MYSSIMYTDGNKCSMNILRHYMKYLRTSQFILGLYIVEKECDGPFDSTVINGIKLTNASDINRYLNKCMQNV